MRFPGSKLLSEDISTKTASFSSLIRNCEDVNLSGYMEVKFPDAEGLILFYLGEQINIIFRSQTKIFLAGAASLKLRNTAELKEGKISVFELPLDMAHMLRGLSNRKEIFQQIFASQPLKDLEERLHEEGHTGSVEVLTSKGTGMILNVRGRFSTAYFETENGVTFEKKEALNRIYALLDRSDVSAQVFQSDFSPDIWRSRQRGSKGRASRLQELLETSHVSAQPSSSPARNLSVSAPTHSTVPLAGDELFEVALSEPEPEPEPEVDRDEVRREILQSIQEQTASLLAVFFFDLESEEVHAEIVTAPEETAERLIVDKLPALVKYLENLTSMKGDDHVETLSMSTESFYLIAKCIPETGEGLALVSDQSQPATLLSALLLNSAHRYVAALSGASV